MFARFGRAVIVGHLTAYQKLTPFCAIPSQPTLKQGVSATALTNNGHYRTSSLSKPR